MNHLEQLIKIYNTLTLISTRGEDTIVMGQCLSAMRNTLTEMQEVAVKSASDTEKPIE